MDQKKESGQNLSLDQILSQSTWKGRRDKIWSFLCPLCQAPRRIAFRPRFGGVQHFVQVLICSVFFTLVTWTWFNWKGMVSFLPFWILFETFYRWRLRAVLSCSLCGFDPYLFLVNPSWARREIETHWKKKFAEKGIAFPQSGSSPVAAQEPGPSLRP